MTGPTGEFVTKRIYDPPAPDDGFRVLVDRLWPRGVSREAAALDLWLPDAAPSPELRKHWHHNPELVDEFTARYQAELDSNPAVDTLLELAAEHPRVTLLYAARDRQVNHAQVLLRHLLDRQRQK